MKTSKILTALCAVLFALTSVGALAQSSRKRDSAPAERSSTQQQAQARSQGGQQSTNVDRSVGTDNEPFVELKFDGASQTTNVAVSIDGVRFRSKATIACVWGYVDFEHGTLKEPGKPTAVHGDGAPFIYCPNGVNGAFTSEPYRLKMDQNAAFKGGVIYIHKEPGAPTKLSADQFQAFSVNEVGPGEFEIPSFTVPPASHVFVGLRFTEAEQLKPVQGFTSMPIPNLGDAASLKAAGGVSRK